MKMLNIFSTRGFLTGGYRGDAQFNMFVFVLSWRWQRCDVFTDVIITLYTTAFLHFYGDGLFLYVFIDDDDEFFLVFFFFFLQNKDFVFVPLLRVCCFLASSWNEMMVCWLVTSCSVLSSVWSLNWSCQRWHLTSRVTRYSGSPACSSCVISVSV